MKTGSGLSLKYVSLCVLCVQNSTLALLMRLSRVGDGPKYKPSTAVFLGEVLKLITCVLWLLKVRPFVCLCLCVLEAYKRLSVSV